MFVLLPLVTELALSSQCVPQSVGAENPSWNLGCSGFRAALLRCSMGRSFSCIVGNTLGLVGARLESFAFSWGLGVQAWSDCLPTSLKC